MKKKYQYESVAKTPIDYDLVIGVNSNTASGKHYLFCDLDSNLPDQDKIDRLMKVCNLTNLELWESSHGKYWLTSFDEIDIQRLIMLNKFIGSDTNYINCIEKNRFATLRIIKKSGTSIPELIKCWFNGQTKQKIKAMNILRDFITLINTDIEPNRITLWRAP